MRSAAWQVSGSRRAREGASSTRRRWAATAAAIVLALTAAAGTAAPAGARSAPPAPVVPGVEDAVGTTLDTAGVADYWTPARQAAATPLDLGADGAIAPAARPRAGAPGARARSSALVAPRSVGKLFFSTPDGDAVCSASAVNSATRDLVITAAHCVHGGGPRACGLLGTSTCPGEYYSRFLFVPRYTAGRAPDGEWAATRVLTFRQWTDSENLDFDQALLRVAPVGGRRLVDVVGGNGLAFGHPPRQDAVAIWGWPAESPYDGETVQRCTGTTRSYEGTSDASMTCPLNGGASGGPWFLSTVDGQVGFIFAVTSRRTLVGTPSLLAHPLPPAILGLIEGIGSSARRVGRAAADAPSTRARAGLAVRAREARVGRGQPLVLTVTARPAQRVRVEVRTSSRGAWRTLTLSRVGRDGVLELASRATLPGVRSYRVRTARATSRTTTVRVLPCPLPAERAAASRTGCTAPSR